MHSAPMRNAVWYMNHEAKARKKTASPHRVSR
jgi:hypothetical protein